ncbi:hypothetical protein SAMN05216588_101188 [Pseudomonas flavescens]|uniref:Uncharacterized protein n=1 Tax=Phytopseudomonas flavescens TaxID=29435 RepID=A0A1G7XMC0_9GAMM|nr:hypothetical protein [Pseudomonas flavescens]SDG85231.1 hypothetical protein SAMN05216588_101188 [Pseudomonas flavescens]
MAGTPASVTHELTERVNEMWGDLTSGGQEINEFAWKRLFRDIQKLQTALECKPDALLLEAAMWAFKLDEEGVQRALNIYSGWYGKTAAWYRARAGFAPRLGRPQMLVDMIDNQYPVGDPHGLLTLLNSSAQMGMFVTARRAIYDLDKLKIDDLPGKAYIRFEQTMQAANYITENDLNERDFADRLQVASEVINKYAPVSVFSLETGDFGVLFEYVLDFDIDKLIEIDNEISDTICVRFEDSLAQHISIGVTPKR